MARRWILPDLLLFGTLALALAAGLAVAASGRDEGEKAAFEELMGALRGGPGLGRVTDLSRCPGAFDPRLGAGCRLRYSPFPGAGVLCPDHAHPPEGGVR